MRKLILSLLFGLAVSLATVVVALAEEYIVNIVVDGKPVALSVIVEGESLVVDSESPGVSIGEIVQTESAADQPQPATSTATANRNANLRSGPGTNYPVAGRVQTGQVLTISGRNEAGDWLQLADSKWIAAFLVDGAPSTLIIGGTSTAQPLQAVPQPTAVPPTATAIPAPTVVATVAPTAVATAAPACDPSYPGVCIPPYPPDLNCPDIPYHRFQVLQPDPHGFDRDKDGIGCES